LRQILAISAPEEDALVITQTTGQSTHRAPEKSVFLEIDFFAPNPTTSRLPADSPWIRFFFPASGR
jgi:hypothetical protein